MSFEEEYVIKKIRNASIEKVIEYLYYDEKKHFEEITGFDGEEELLIMKIHNAIIHDDWSEFPDGKNHIFVDLTILAFWDRLEEQIRR